MFIELHGIPAGECILVNIDAISYVIEDGAGVLIYRSDGQHFNVSETYEQIAGRIENASSR